MANVRGMKRAGELAALVKRVADALDVSSRTTQEISLPAKDYDYLTGYWAAAAAHGFYRVGEVMTFAGHPIVRYEDPPARAW